MLNRFLEIPFQKWKYLVSLYGGDFPYTIVNCSELFESYIKGSSTSNTLEILEKKHNNIEINQRLIVCTAGGII